MKTNTYKTKSTTLGNGRSRQRLRTEKQALALLDEARLPAAQRLAAVERIRAARQPLAEARRIIERVRRLQLRGILEGDGLDLSDVQELRVRLHRRDGGVWSPHADILARMERGIAAGDLDRPTFECMAATLLAMDQAIPASQRRQAA